MKFTDKLITAAIGFVVVLLVVATLIQMTVVWWVSLPLLAQVGMGGVGVLVAAVGVDRLSVRALRFSPLMYFIRSGKPTTGREAFSSGLGDQVVRTLASSSDESVPVDYVMKRDPNGSASPQIDRETSIGMIGRTKTGKSTTIKALHQHWGYDEPSLLHAIRGPDGTNELGEFVRSKGLNVEMMSSRDSEVRWNPFLDANQSIRAMESIVDGLFSARQVKETGWDEPARTLLLAVLTLTNARYGDFARMPDVLEMDAAEIIDEMQEIPNGEVVTSALRGSTDSDLGTIHNRVQNRVRPILLSDICDEDLPPRSMREFFTGSNADALVLDTVPKDRWAAGFWRLLISQSIDIAYETPGKQQFVLDEINSLPAIPNLNELASSGRGSGARGIIAIQDVHQFEVKYGDMADSIWENCPNRFCFRVGGEASAEFALGPLGEQEMTSSEVASPQHRRDKPTVTRSTEAKKPLVSGDLTSLDTGEALVQSDYGWWLCKLTEPEL